MANYAILIGYTVVNVAVSDRAIDSGWVLIPEDSQAWVGWSYEDGEFSPPES